MVRVGLLGSGPVATFSRQGRVEVPDTQVVAGHAVDLFSSPCRTHCTWAPRSWLRSIISTWYVTPLGQHAGEARQILEALECAGVLHGSAKSDVFRPAFMRATLLLDTIRERRECR